MDRETVEASMSLSHKPSLAHNSLLVPLSTPPAPHTQLWVGEGDKRWTLITRRFGARQPWGSRHWRLIVVARVAADTQIPHSTTEKSLTPITSGRRHQSRQDNTIFFFSPCRVLGPSSLFLPLDFARRVWHSVCQQTS